MEWFLKTTVAGETNFNAKGLAKYLSDSLRFGCKVYAYRMIVVLGQKFLKGGEIRPPKVGKIRIPFDTGIISALPATTHTETRVLQLNIPVAGGIRGKAVF